jgi:hypothetical protein
MSQLLLALHSVLTASQHQRRGKLFPLSQEQIYQMRPTHFSCNFFLSGEHMNIMPKTYHIASLSDKGCYFRFKYSVGKVMSFGVQRSTGHFLPCYCSYLSEEGTELILIHGFVGPCHPSALQFLLSVDSSVEEVWYILH